MAAKSKLTDEQKAARTRENNAAWGDLCGFGRDGRDPKATACKNNRRVPWAKYCSEHAAASRAWMKKNVWEPAGKAREARDSEHAELWADALKSAAAAVAKLAASRKKNDGEAYVQVIKTTSSFAHWTRREGHVGNDGFLTLPDSGTTRAKAVAKYLTDGGVDVRVVLPV